MVTVCVCAHEAAEHHAWTGPCNACGCSYWEEDLGRDHTTTHAAYTPGAADKYNGRYAQKYQLDQESA